MAYSKTVWNNLSVPALNADNLNKIEQGIADAHNLIENSTLGGTTGQRPDTPKLGQNYFDTTLGKPIWWTGSNWVDVLGETV